jgi:rubrerythrin
MTSKSPRKCQLPPANKAVCKKFREYIKDETHGNKDYLALAKRVKCPRQKEALRKMAKDERKHRKWLKIMESHSCKRR